MDQSSFRPPVKLPIARSVQNGAPLAMSHAVPTPSMPVLVGPHQPLRSAFLSQFPSLTSSIAPVHLIRPSSLYMPQIPAAQTLGVLRPFKTSGNSTTNRLGYFQQVPSSINSNPLIPRGPQLAPSAFMAGSGGQAASALPAPDAMGYLEQVKMQFAAKPQVYNEFLETMKNFKDQRLDLLGVVKRIGALFFGFTHLINGFNTFMPHGYRLDVSNDKAERIVVHSATGKMHSFSENDLLEERQSSKIRNLEPSVVYKPSVKDQSAENTFMPPESSSAIAYVNKIKIRFQNNPEVYQRFLDILQAYQKEQLEKPTNSSGRSSEADAQVFSQVAQLFANDKDLLEEFSQFLPDAPLMQLEKPSPSVVAATSTTTSMTTTTTTTTTTTSSSSSSSKETAESVNATVTDNGEKVAPLSSESTPATGEGDGDLKEQPLRSARRKRKCPAAAPPVPYSETIMTRKRTRSAAAQLARQNAALVKKSNEDRRDEKKPKRDVTFDQYMFLEKLRYTVSNDEMYKGLLRVLKLFSQSYLTVTDVQDLFRSYVPDETELLDWFSKPALPSSESSPVNAGEGTVNQRRTISDGCPDVDFSRCKQLGVSYRLIPAKYQYPKCTGRTPLGKEVLNFKYLSFPVFQSEENPKTTSKRSPFQETLYTTEDEHFETDIVIAVNRCLTEGLLSAEAMVRRLKQKYSLDRALNTRSVTIAQRALRIVFNRAWKEFYVYVRKYPAHAIPLVLKVLMQKNDDWHKNLRRMKPMWQEMNINCYWKALDYHDITFKSDDQKDKRTRSLLAAVEALFDQRRAKAEKENREIQLGPHVIVQFPSCTQAFHDTGELVVHYMKRQTNVGLLYKRQMAIIVKVMLPPLFNLKPASLSDVEQELPAVENRDKSSSTANGSNSRNASNKGGRCRGGYRRRAGAKGRGNAKVATTPSSSTESTAVDKNEKSESLQDFPILEDLTLLGPMPRYSILFGPSPWYVFLRLYCILSERLSGFYDASRDLASKFGQEEFSYLYETTVLRNRFTSNSKVQPDDLYNQFLNLTKHWLDGGIESTTYEDAVRDVFTLRAYKAFTIDQIVHTMYRQLYVIVSELTPVKALKLHETWAPRIRCAPNNVERQLLEKSYQAEAIALTEGQKCFKIQFLPLENRKVTFELLDKAPRKCQESNAIVPVKAGDINQAMLQRNVNRAMDYFAKQLLKVQEETGTKCGRLNGASRTGPQMARTVSQLFYWQRSTRVYLPLTSVQARNRHNFKLHMLRKFWKKDQTSRTDDDLQPETHGEIFCRFHEKWTAENVTKEQNSYVNELLSGAPGKKNMSAAWMSRCEEPCSRRPPYFVVNRYLKWKEK